MSDGKVEMVVGNENKQVFLRFKKAMKVVVFDPQNAIDVACAMTDQAFIARDGLNPVGDTLKSELIERHRITLTQRISIMLGSMRKDARKTDGQIALAVVEACLKEIF